MFRMGGSAENSGIMDGMRQRYDNGGDVEQVLKTLDEKAPSPNFGRSQFLTEFAFACWNLANGSLAATADV